jgi:hypothetical protein
VQLISLEDCPKLDALRQFENGLFRSGFVREVTREDPIAYEIVDHLLSGEPKLIAFRKSDFQRIEERGSLPYKELVNRYKIAACEEPVGGLYLVVVRHDPDSADKFVGARLQTALDTTGCVVKPVAPPRDLGLYTDTTEDDLLRFIKRGRCRDYALGK